MESLLKFDPSCDEARPAEADLDGADQGMYLKLPHDLSLMYDSKVACSS